MKVVAIQASPHRGNTYERVERFGEVLTELGDVEFEHVALADVHLEPCRGCFLCFMRGADACPIQDDRAAIEDKLIGADGVVFATPVHSMHVSTLLKMLVDRMAYTFHRPRYFGRYALGIAVTGGVGQKEALGYIRMFASTWGFEYVGDLSYVDPPRNTTMPRMMDNTERAPDVARRFHELMRERPPRRLSLNDHLTFHMMRAVYARLKGFSPTDYAYWKEQGLFDYEPGDAPGWLEPGARYFTEHARIGWLKSLYPRLLAGVMGRTIDRRMRGLERPPQPDPEVGSEGRTEE